MKIYRRWKLLLASCMIPIGSLAQGTPQTSTEVPPQSVMSIDTPIIAAPSLLRHSVEIYTSRQHLSAGYADWSEAGLRGNYEIGANLLQLELASTRRFDESGVYLGLGDTVTINSDWFATLSVGAGSGASYLPRYRIDGFINRKLLPDKNLIGTLGLGYYSAPDGHADRSLSLGSTYYFTQPWIVQAEIKFNTSNPGSVHTRQQFIAATWGSDKQTQITGRYAWGSEGYQSIGAGASLVDFRSHQASIAVRQWLSAHWGVSANMEHYKNPLYQRNGINLGLFWQFQ
jgi:YaiO family outer membrane protein